MRNSAPSPSPKPSSISARSTGSVMAAASASSCTHMPMTSTLSPADVNSSRTICSTTGIRSSSSSPTFTTASTRRFVRRK